MSNATSTVTLAKRCFKFGRGNSSKFWGVRAEGYFPYGRIGSTDQTSFKSLESA